MLPLLTMQLGREKRALLTMDRAREKRATRRQRPTPRIVLALMVGLLAAPCAAQQRPMITEDSEPVGAGRFLIESGVDIARGQRYPVSGLEGNLLRLPTIGISIGLSSIAELQIDGGFYNRLSITQREAAPLSGLLNVTGNRTTDVEDFVVATKIRMAPEGPGHPSFGIRFATRLPNASNESGLGLDTIDFFATLLTAKTVQSLRLVGNLGIGILSDPVTGNRQNDVVTYGATVARALTNRSEVVAELNGRTSVRAGGAFPGTENRGRLLLGARYTPGSIRFDAGALIGLTTVGPTLGFTAGLTYVFNAFTVP
jgi:hypothetical protein